MILLLVLAISIVIAIVRGGKLSRLASLPLRWPALPLLAFALQIVVIYFPSSGGQGLSSLHTAMLVGSYLILLLAIWMNRRLPGMAFIALGLLLNLAVMLANGGYMPITPDTVQRIGHGDHVVVTGTTARVGHSKDVVLPKEQTHLWFLSDVFPLPPPFPLPSAFSLGDVFTAVGGFLIVQRALLGPASPRARSQPGPVPPSNGT